LQIDLKHEKEQKALSIRQRLESELVDALPLGFIQEEISRLAEAVLPQGFGPNLGLVGATKGLQIVGMTGGSINVNLNQQQIQAVNSVIAHEIEGDVHLTESDRQLTKIIAENGGLQVPELISSVHELADDGTPSPKRLMAAKRLKGFLLQVASKIGDVALSVLTKYLESKLPQ
jgi:hypothetical protein